MRIPVEEGQHYHGGYVYFTGGCQKLPEALADYITSHDGTITYSQSVFDWISEKLLFFEFLKSEPSKKLETCKDYQIIRMCSGQ